jgi:hypothetical protein
MPKQLMERTVRAAASLAIVACLSGGAPAALAGHGHGNSGATITGSFADSCRDFTTHSTKDIRFVELHYQSGGVVRHHCIHGHDWSVDGGPGDEIDFAKVKSGTTLEEFVCEASNEAPEARLEIRTPPVDQSLEHCYDFFSGGLACEQSSPRTDWTSTGQIPDSGGTESGFFHWGCGALTDPSLCPPTVSFRGIGSRDADGDIVSWSLDFGDGTSASGTWSTPPAAVAHAYAPSGTSCTAVVNGISNVCVITLTVTDASGQSDSDTMRMVFVDQTPD